MRKRSMADTLDPKDKDWKPDPVDTYLDWVNGQGIPIVTGFLIEDINAVELAPWDVKGVP